MENWKWDGIGEGESLEAAEREYVSGAVAGQKKKVTLYGVAYKKSLMEQRSSGV